MDETGQQSVRQLELRLLRCSLPPPCSPPQPFPTHTHPVGSLGHLAEDVVSLIENGRYVDALSSEAARVVFRFVFDGEFSDTKECADMFYDEVVQSAEQFLRSGGEERESAGSTADDESDALLRGLIVTALGVAAFLAFTQRNLTGPPSEAFPSVVLHFHVAKDNNMSEWDMWAREQIICDGSDLLGRFGLLQYLVFASRLLVKVRDSSLDSRNLYLNKFSSNSWWLLRILLFKQRILEDMSPSLYSSLQVLLQGVLHEFGSLDNVCSYWSGLLCEGEASTIVTSAHLEAGITEYTYHRLDSCRKHFHNAEESCGLELSLTGVLGFRTIHQVEAKAQMVLVSASGRETTTDMAPLNGSTTPVNMSAGFDSHSQTGYEDCDILLAPRLVCNGGDADPNTKALKATGPAVLALNTIQQAVTLAHCLLLKRSMPDDEMQKWQMAPFIEAVDAQLSSHFIVKFLCNILRIRWESTRSHTKQRALLMMENLVNGVFEASPSSAERIKFSYAISIPTISALRKEYGELLISCGLIGESLPIFEDLELWDNLIHCYCLLQKKAAAVDLIRTVLSNRPDDPKLWCSLGDVTNNDEYYKKALEVSKGKSARALRSLARGAYNREDYGLAISHWEAALSLNSLFPDGWFALGSAALKAREFDKAIDGFTRAVQLDPDNGEAWNNLACIHMIKKRSKEAFIAFKEALKFRRSSWQMWENYGQVAMDINNIGQALEALKMTFELSHNKRVDNTLLERVLTEMEKRSNDTTDKQTNQLMNFLGSVLQQIIRSGKGEGTWGFYARWYKLRGDLMMCAEALLKQVRAYQGSDLWHNEERFKKFASASLQLCQVYIEIASTTGSRRELSAANMHLRSTIKQRLLLSFVRLGDQDLSINDFQAVDFSATEEYRDLKACHSEVENLLASGSVKVCQ